jgi:hypothetical protein
MHAMMEKIFNHHSEKISKYFRILELVGIGIFLILLFCI